MSDRPPADDQAIPVAPYAWEPTSNSFAGTIRDSLALPAQQRAREWTAELKGTTLTGAFVTFAELVLCFSSDHELHAFVDHGKVAWEVRPGRSLLAPERLKLKPLTLDWGKLGRICYAPAELLEKRIGHAFQRLFVSSAGLHVYLKGQMILTASALIRTDTHEDVLYVFEET